MSTIFWDTNLFIYLIEEFSPYSERVTILRQNMLAHGDSLVTSTLTLGEVLAKPLQSQREDLAKQYRELLTSAVVLLAPFDAVAAERYALIRARFPRQEIAPPDAIQLACASAVGVDVFYTNDNRLFNKVIPGVQEIRSLT